jgi:hypothetical protein
MVSFFEVSGTALATERCCKEGIPFLRYFEITHLFFITASGGKYPAV